MTIQDLANKMLEQFETKGREGGGTFQTLKDAAPDWMTDVCREAHDDFLPDDFIYSVIVDSLEALTNYDDESEARDSLEPDIYNRDLLAWVSSNLHRAGYVNDAVSEGMVDLTSFDLFSALQAGQIQEKQVIFDGVVRALTDKLDEVEDVA